MLILFYSIHDVSAFTFLPHVLTWFISVFYPLYHVRNIIPVVQVEVEPK